MKAVPDIVYYKKWWLDFYLLQLFGRHYSYNGHDVTYNPENKQGNDDGSVDRDIGFIKWKNKRKAKENTALRMRKIVDYFKTERSLRCLLAKAT